MIEVMKNVNKGTFELKVVIWTFSLSMFSIIDVRLNRQI